MEKAAGRSSGFLMQDHKIQTRKKPVSNKNKKEYLKWKRERSRTRSLNEDSSMDPQEKKWVIEGSSRSQVLIDLVLALVHQYLLHLLCKSAALLSRCSPLKTPTGPSCGTLCAVSGT